jgi:hypothetical protein
MYHFSLTWPHRYRDVEDDELCKLVRPLIALFHVCPLLYVKNVEMKCDT